MQRRGHSAYKHVDMEAVKKRAEALPVDDVPPEIIRLLPLDGAHDKMQPNKNATPVSGEGSLDQMRKNFDVPRYNAVVHEKSSLDEGDEPAQVRACVEHIVRLIKRLMVRMTASKRRWPRSWGMITAHAQTMLPRSALV